MRPVRACTSTELAAFRSLEWSYSTALFGGVSSGTVRWPPGSVPGCTIRLALLLSSVHLTFQSGSTLGFSRSSHCSIGCAYPLSHPLSCRSWGVPPSGSKLHPNCRAGVSVLPGQAGLFKSCLEACYSPHSARGLVEGCTLLFPAV